MTLESKEEVAVQRREPEHLGAWIKSDLSSRYGAVLKEEIPAGMADLVRSETR